ncbi:MAG: hypothetical protein OXN15_03115 [Chloroflexota bacterium]|nr:hypothetical protein [Chloroflexota bacterium]MDE2900000.1 hypothetical protein [Chloroflexota bacterium]MDE2969026.1 hypothetical protein [Chloroflexota bacterium]
MQVVAAVPSLVDAATRLLGAIQKHRQDSASLRADVAAFQERLTSLEHLVQEQAELTASIANLQAALDRRVKLVAATSLLTAIVAVGALVAAFAV